MFFSSKKGPAPEEFADAILEMFTEEERKVLIQRRIDLKELIIERIKRNTKKKYKTIEEAKKNVECYVRLAQANNNIIKKYDRYDVWILSDMLFKALFYE